MKASKFSRRKFLGASLAAAGASAIPLSAKAEEPAPTANYSDYLVYLRPDEDELDATEKDIEGPYYREGSPFRSTLFEKGAKGERLVVSGTVVARNGRPLKNALLDIWQCNADGRYDNDDAQHPPKKDQFVLRGKVKTNDKGEYQFTTIKPVPYGIGQGQFRPAHIHLKVSRDGYTALTTQIYFKGDRYNKADPWYKAAREIDPKPDAKKVLQAAFKVVLARA